MCERMRGWVPSQAVGALADYKAGEQPDLYHEAESWLTLVSSERE